MPPVSTTVDELRVPQNSQMVRKEALLHLEPLVELAHVLRSFEETEDDLEAGRLCKDTESFGALFLGDFQGRDPLSHVHRPFLT